MKKIFALLMVIGMLAVAGSAFAADGGHSGGIVPAPTVDTGLSNTALEENGWTALDSSAVDTSYTPQAESVKETAIQDAVEEILGAAAGAEVTSVTNLPPLKANALEGGKEYPVKVSAASFFSNGSAGGGFWMSIIRNGIAYLMNKAGTVRRAEVAAADAESDVPFSGFDVTDADGKSYEDASELDPNDEVFVVLKVKEGYVASGNDTLELAVATVEEASTSTSVHRGSGGGCSAGFSAAALLALSGLAILRKSR